MEYAGVWPRLVAFILDFIIVLALTIAIFFWEREIVQQSWVPIMVLVVPLVYFTGFWARRGQTPGMMLFRLKVVRPEGRPLGLNGALLRGALFAGVFFISMGTLFSVFLPLFVVIGCYMIATDRQRRGLPDRIADSRVIRVERRQL